MLRRNKKIIKKYKLELNQKTRIYSYKESFEFLGFSYFIKKDKIIMKVKNQTKRRFKRKMKNLNSLVNRKIIDYNQLLQVKSSYLGHLSYGNTNKLIKNTLDKYVLDYDNIGTKVLIDGTNILYKN